MRIEIALKSEAAESKAETAVKPSKAAFQLVLAHYLEREIDEGQFKDHADIARHMGWSRARVTQIMNLLLLGPEVQKQILASQGAALSSRFARIASTNPIWHSQCI